MHCKSSQPEDDKSQSILHDVTESHMHAYLCYYCSHRLWNVISFCLLRQTADTSYICHRATRVPLLSTSHKVPILLLLICHLVHINKCHTELIIIYKEVTSSKNYD